MKIRHVVPALALSLLAAGSQAEEALVKSATAQAKFAYGLMMQAGDRVIFSPCRDSSYTTMDDVSPDRAVTRALNDIGLAAGKKLYVELMAVVEAGVLKASALNLARREGRCQLPGTADEAWRGAGNEPGWVLAAGGDKVLLKRHGKPDLTAPYSADKPAVFASDKLSFRLENKICRDSMADAVFGWTATVTADGQTLQGCAWQR